MSEDSVFSRWSRRKRQVAEEERAAPSSETSLPPASPVPDMPEPASAEEETELLERLGLPCPEQMSSGDDFSLFMKAGVPEFLRKRALRVLWRSNPVLANLDGLNDYDEDFRSPEMTRKVLATAYKVGRGFLPPDPTPAPTPDLEPDLVAGGRTDPPIADTIASDIGLAERRDNIEVPAGSGRDTDPDHAETTEKPDSEREMAFRPTRMRFET